MPPSHMSPHPSSCQALPHIFLKLRKYHYLCIHKPPSRCPHKYSVFFLFIIPRPLPNLGYPHPNSPFLPFTSLFFFPPIAKAARAYPPPNQSQADGNRNTTPSPFSAHQPCSKPPLLSSCSSSIAASHTSSFGRIPALPIPTSTRSHQAPVCRAVRATNTSLLVATCQIYLSPSWQILSLPFPAVHMLLQPPKTPLMTPNPTATLPTTQCPGTPEILSLMPHHFCATPKAVHPILPTRTPSVRC